LDKPEFAWQVKDPDQDLITLSKTVSADLPGSGESQRSSHA
jgi:hypothetical protein